MSVEKKHVLGVLGCALLSAVVCLVLRPAFAAEQSGLVISGGLGSGQVRTNFVTFTDRGLLFGAAVQLNVLGPISATYTNDASFTNTITGLVQCSVDGNNWSNVVVLSVKGAGTLTAFGISNLTASVISHWRVFTVTSTAVALGSNSTYEVWVGH